MIALPLLLTCCIRIVTTLSYSLLLTTLSYSLPPGAVLHWIHFLPHYKTVPEPPPDDGCDALLRQRDGLRQSALQIASYAGGRPEREARHGAALASR
jgi:hypothetical protein